MGFWSDSSPIVKGAIVVGVGLVLVGTALSRLSRGRGVT